MIPKVIHFVWVSDDGQPPPDWGAQNMDAFRRLNPWHEIRVHGADSLRPEYRRLYDVADKGCQKADLIRLSVLREFGGWYWDLDFMPFRPLADIESAYMLDGSTMFVSRQQGNLNPRWTHANAPLAVGLNWPGWPVVDQVLADRQPPLQYCDLGPRLILDIMDGRPHLFTVAGADWVFPAPTRKAGAVWKRLQGGARLDHVRTLCPGTGGQLPFAMHLWAGNKRTIEYKGDVIQSFPGSNRKRAVIAVMQQQWRHTDKDAWQPFPAIAEGLHRLGWTVDVMPLGEPDLAAFADLVVVWNGRKGLYLEAADQARTAGVPVLYVEHGFLGDRKQRVQVNAGGSLHWATWATPEYLMSPAPARAFDRLANVVPAGVQPTTQRYGYVLGLGQIDGDSQLDDSDVQCAADFERILARSGAEPLVWRDHPLAKPRSMHARYAPRVDGQTLRQQTDAARVAVMINSNSGNECLAWGCPVVAMGPALYLAAGLATPWTQQTITAAIDSPARPDPERVRNYLAHLADRQYSHADLSAGPALARVLQEAGVNV